MCVPHIIPLPLMELSFLMFPFPISSSKYVIFPRASFGLPLAWPVPIHCDKWNWHFNHQTTVSQKSLTSSTHKGQSRDGILRWVNRWQQEFVTYDWKGRSRVQGRDYGMATKRKGNPWRIPLASLSHLHLGSVFLALCDVSRENNLLLLLA
jgi:hypothetical protein